jgi:glycosyltransferase involved in cell wall biosynthesis
MEFASMRNAFQFFTSRKKREQENLTFLQKSFEYYKPDAVLIWGMWNLPRSLPALAEQLMPGRVVYYIGDYWVTLPSQFEDYWNAPARNLITGFPKLVLRPIARQMLARDRKPDLQLEHTLFPSAFMRNELERKGIPLKTAKNIYGAINTEHYLDHRTEKKQARVTSLLYIGRLAHEKGVHTAIQAVGLLTREHGFKNLKLTIVGDGDPDYVDRLYQLVEQENIASIVTFLPAQPKDVLPDLYLAADIFLFTSIWAEPFGRVIVEAMASGTTVVGTAVGGAAEILTENENALIFTPDDPTSLSQQLKRLIESPHLRDRLAKSGRHTAVEKFDIKRMTTEIESYLQAIIHR